MDILDKLVVAFDRRQRRRLHIWEYTDDPDCILRLSRTTARTGAELADGTVVRAGDPIGVIHVWNDRMPQIPPSGPNLAWARDLYRSLTHSLRLLAQYMVDEPTLQDIRAFGGHLAIVYTPGAMGMLRRLGLEILEPIKPRDPVTWVVNVASRVWVWLLRRAFNPESARGLRPRELQQRPVWLSRRVLMARYGPEEARAAAGSETGSD